MLMRAAALACGASEDKAAYAARAASRAINLQLREPSQRRKRPHPWPSYLETYDHLPQAYIYFLSILTLLPTTTNTRPSQTTGPGPWYNSGETRNGVVNKERPSGYRGCSPKDGAVEACRKAGSLLPAWAKNPRGAGSRKWSYGVKEVKQVPS
jgi:hypothetical protein